jgi:hypothetical protein
MRLDIELSNRNLNECQPCKEEQFVDWINKSRAAALKRAPGCLEETCTMIKVDDTLIEVRKKFKEIFGVAE